MLVVSDIEGTLTTGVMWQGIAQYMQDNGLARQRRMFAYSSAPALLMYRARLIPRQAFKNQWIARQARFLRGQSETFIQAMCAWVVEQVLWPNRRPEVIRELSDYAQQGHTIYLASGLYLPMAAGFAMHMGLEAGAAAGTSLQMEAGRFTGRFATAICVGEEKKRQVQGYAGGRTILAAYGDTSADIPMLELSQKPVAVYPDDELAPQAARRGWRILG